MLRQLGHTVVLLREVLPNTTPDSEVFAYAAARQLVMVTCNRDDFVALARTQPHCGLIVLFRRKSQESLDAVLADAAGTPFAEFAANIRRDLAAVQATLDLPWTTSPAEGQINRLKMLKRTMYGRAGFPLLRARVLHAA